MGAARGAGGMSHDGTFFGSFVFNGLRGRIREILTVEPK